MAAYMTINFVRIPAIASPFLNDIAAYQSHTGYAEEIRVIICTCAVVNVIRVNSSCETAKFRTIWRRTSTLTAPSLGADLPLKLKPQTPETTITVNMGVARRKSGRFDNVQYLNHPQFL